MGAEGGTGCFVFCFAERADRWGGHEMSGRRAHARFSHAHTCTARGTETAETSRGLLSSANMQECHAGVQAAVEVRTREGSLEYLQVLAEFSEVPLSITRNV